VMDVNGEGHDCAPSSDVRAYEIGSPAADHNRRRVCGAADNGWHDRRVRHAQAAHATHTQLAIHDGIDIFAHSGSANGMPETEGACAREIDEFRFGFGFGTRDEFGFANPVEGLLAHELSGGFYRPQRRREIAV